MSREHRPADVLSAVSASPRIGPAEAARLRAIPARFPPHGAWPGVMRADLVAAFFDCRDTGELARRVRDGDIPAPTALRGAGRQREPVWALDACRNFIARRHQILEHETAADSVADLMARAPRLPLPRYVRRKWLRGEQAWGHFFEVPTWAKRAGCPLSNEALGTDYDAACRRAETILLKQLDSWRTAGQSDLVPDRTAEGTFDWLSATFKASAKYTKLSRSQRTNHDYGLSLVAGYVLRDNRRFGSLLLKSIATDAVDRLFDKLLVVHEPVRGSDGAPLLDAKGQPVTKPRERRTTVNHAMKSCRRAWNVVRRSNPKLVPEGNPFSRMGLEDTLRETPTGTYQHLLAFVAGCDAGGHASLGSAAMVAWEWLQREEHIFGALNVEHYRPRERPDEVFIVHPKTGEDVWIPLLDRGKPLFPELMDRLDAIKREWIGGLLIVRDWKDKAAGVPVPWVARSGDLTYMRHVTKKVIRAAGLPDDLSFTSWRHGGMTELGDAELTDAQIRAISRHKSARTLPRYVKRTQRQIIAGTRKRRLTRTNQGGLSE